MLSGFILNDLIDTNSTRFKKTQKNLSISQAEEGIRDASWEM